MRLVKRQSRMDRSKGRQAASVAELRSAQSGRKRKEQRVSTFHDLEMATITGETQAFSEYEGKVCLIVNLASA